MTPELFHILIKWLVSDDEVQRRHAEWRLARPDVAIPDRRPAALPPIVHAPTGCCNG